MRVGTEIDFDSVLVRLVEMAYSRVDMVGKRGEFAVRGGILDLFSPTADHPVRIEFWGDEVSELRYFSVADQRSLADVDVDSVIAPPCRELILTADVRDRAAALAAENQADASLVEMLDKISAGIPVEGMEALLPVLKPGELQLLSDVLPEGAHILLCDPEKVRTRATDLVRTGPGILGSIVDGGVDRRRCTARHVDPQRRRSRSRCLRVPVASSCSRICRSCRQTLVDSQPAGVGKR